MIFLAPLIIVMLIVFGVDYIYFSDKISHKNEQNSTKKNKNKAEFIDKILK